MELPDNVVGEIIAGELHVSPRPAPRHARAASKLGRIIDGPYDSGVNGPGGWIILDEPEIHKEEHIFVPDIAGWKKDRLTLKNEDVFISVEPDWACEILSPGTTKLDKVKKMPLYAEIGIKFFWLVDPAIKTLDVYVNDHANWKLLKTYSDHDKVRAVSFDAIEFDLSLLWLPD